MLKRFVLIVKDTCFSPGFKSGLASSMPKWRNGRNSMIEDSDSWLIK